jgi:hypothetical protein
MKKPESGQAKFLRTLKQAQAAGHRVLIEPLLPIYADLLRSNVERLDTLAAQLQHRSPSLAEVADLMLITGVICGIGWDFAAPRTAALQARNAKAQKVVLKPGSAEAALLAAIQAHDTGTVSPWKQAGSMLPALHAAGFATIKVDACARRIKKLRTSIRTAAKVPHV